MVYEQKTLEGKITLPPIHNHHEFCGLMRVRNPHKRTEISEKLSNPDPSHYERVWMVNYLLGCGWTGNEIYNLISCENEWDHYSDNMTFNQVMGIEKGYKRRNKNHFHVSVR